MRGEPAGARLRVLSWNLYGAPLAPDPEARMRRVGELVARGGYDLALLQEVWTRSQSEALLGPTRATHDAWTSGPHRALVGRQGGLTALLRRDSDWQLSRHAFVAFENEASDALFWQGDGIADKGIQHLQLRSRKARRAVDVFHTHLQAAYTPSALFDGAAVRRGQLGELERLARGVPRPSLAFGDFNLVPGSANYARLTRGWVDLTRDARAGCGCGTSTDDGVDSGRWIDYALARRDAHAPVEAMVRRLAPRDELGALSDHAGLDVLLEWSDAPASGALLDGAALGTLAASSSRRELLGAGVYALCRLAGLAPGRAR